MSLYLCSVLWIPLSHHSQVLNVAQNFKGFWDGDLFWFFISWSTVFDCLSCPWNGGHHGRLWTLHCDWLSSLHGAGLWSCCDSSASQNQKEPFLSCSISFYLVTTHPLHFSSSSSSHLPSKVIGCFFLVLFFFVFEMNFISSEEFYCFYF